MDPLCERGRKAEYLPKLKRRPEQNQLKRNNDKLFYNVLESTVFFSYRLFHICFVTTLQGAMCVFWCCFKDILLGYYLKLS